MAASLRMACVHWVTVQALLGSRPVRSFWTTAPTHGSWAVVRAGILGLTKTAPYGRKVTVETFKQGDLFGRPFVERTGPLSKRRLASSSLHCRPQAFERPADEYP